MSSEPHKHWRIVIKKISLSLELTSLALIEKHVEHDSHSSLHKKRGRICGSIDLGAAQQLPQRSSQ
jgi:hypothetical protein